MGTHTWNINNGLSSFSHLCRITNVEHAHRGLVVRQFRPYYGFYGVVAFLSKEVREKEGEGVACVY